MINHRVNTQRKNFLTAIFEIQSSFADLCLSLANVCFEVLEDAQRHSRAKCETTTVDIRSSP